jgi:hypothetical protein
MPLEQTAVYDLIFSYGVLGWLITRVFSGTFRFAGIGQGPGTAEKLFHQPKLVIWN